MKDLHTLQVCGVVVFGSVWRDQLVLHNYCVIISECQKVTFMGVKAKKMSKHGKNQSCSKLPEMAKKMIENVMSNCSL